MLPPSFRAHLAALGQDYTVNSADTLFPNLPLELREKIYSNLTNAPCTYLRDPPCTYFGDTSASLFKPYRYSPDILLIPTICTVSPTMWTDAGLWHIRNTKARLTAYDLRNLATFLDTFPGVQGWQSVRKVEFFEFGKYARIPSVVVTEEETEKAGRDNEEKQDQATKPQSPYSNFFSLSTGLTHLTLNFCFGDLFASAPEGSPRGSYGTRTTLDEFVRKYALHGLFNATNLKEINFVITNELPRVKRDSEVMFDGLRLITDTGDWLKRGFVVRGGCVRYAVAAC
jgi:hypothetical protein